MHKNNNSIEDIEATENTAFGAVHCIGEQIPSRFCSSLIDI